MLSSNTAPLADDLIIGAKNIARFIFDDENKQRRIYALSEANALPTFRIGGTIAIRRSVLLQYISEQERLTISKDISPVSC
jgi:hypothetical protein